MYIIASISHAHFLLACARLLLYTLVLYSRYLTAHTYTLFRARHRIVYRELDLLQLSREREVLRTRGTAARPARTENLIITCNYAISRSSSNKARKFRCVNHRLFLYKSEHELSRKILYTKRKVKKRFGFFGLVKIAYIKSAKSNEKLSRLYSVFHSWQVRNVFV